MIETHHERGLTSTAKRIIEDVLYITIATVDDQGQPWNTPVYAAYDDDFNFYWTSWKDNQHSRNIRKNWQVFLVIYDSTAPEDTGEGVYCKAISTELTNPDEIEHALRLLWERAGKRRPEPHEVLGDYPRRVYRASPTEVWVNGDGEVNGHYVDIRVEVDL